jgi:hypothetical protein
VWEDFSTPIDRCSKVRLCLVDLHIAALMFGFMWSMYSNTRLITSIQAMSAILFVASVWLVRSQQKVGDVSYMV